MKPIPIGPHPFFHYSPFIFITDHLCADCTVKNVMVE